MIENKDLLKSSDLREVLSDGFKQEPSDHFTHLVIRRIEQKEIRPLLKRKSNIGWVAWVIFGVFGLLACVSIILGNNGKLLVGDFPGSFDIEFSSTTYSLFILVFCIGVLTAIDIVYRHIRI